MSEKWYLKISLILLIMLLILGCAISFGGSSKDDDIESLKLELTRQALQLTQPSHRKFRESIQPIAARPII